MFIQVQGLQGLHDHQFKECIEKHFSAKKQSSYIFIDQNNKILYDYNLKENIVKDDVLGYFQCLIQGDQLNMPVFFWYLVKVTYQVYATMQVTLYKVPEKHGHVQLVTLQFLLYILSQELLTNKSG